MTYSINCRPENYVFEPFMSVSAHDDQVRAQLSRQAHNFAAGWEEWITV